MPLNKKKYDVYNLLYLEKICYINKMYQHSAFCCLHAGHWWRSGDELISDVFLWTHSHGRAKAGRPARTYIQQLCADKGFIPEDLLEVMDDGERWRERVKDIRADGASWRGFSRGLLEKVDSDLNRECPFESRLSYLPNPSTRAGYDT